MTSRKSKKRLTRIMSLKGECTKYILDHSNDSYREFITMFGNVFPLLPYNIEMIYDIEGEDCDLNNLYFTNKNWVSRLLKPIIIGVEIIESKVYLYRLDGSEDLLPLEVKEQITECVQKIIDDYNYIINKLSENLEKRKEIEAQREFGFAGDESYHIIKEMK